MTRTVARETFADFLHDLLDLPGPLLPLGAFFLQGLALFQKGKRGLSVGLGLDTEAVIYVTLVKSFLTIYKYIITNPYLSALSMASFSLATASFLAVSAAESDSRSDWITSFAEVAVLCCILNS